MRLFVPILLPLLVTAFLWGAPQSTHAQNRSTIVDTAATAGNFKTLVAAVQAAGLEETLRGEGPFTVFAPTDEAFAQLPAGTLDELLQPENRPLLTAILTYHVVPARVTAREAFSLSNAATVNGQRLALNFDNRKLSVNDARLLTTDIECRNGVIHVIDSVLLPQQATIPQVAQEAGSFGTLLAAVSAAELADVLGGPGPFTVFAPTDDAFARLPEGTLDDLLKPENRQQLVDILKYHVVSGRVYLDQALKARRAQTLQGQSLQVNVSADGARVHEAALLTPDIEAANGVIHVIDRVLLPQPLTAREAMERLETAVARGSAIYNHGDHHGCAVLYEKTCRQLLDEGRSSLPPAAVSVMQESLHRAERMHSMRDRAWALRHGIDRAHASLRHADRMSRSVSR